MKGCQGSATGVARISIRKCSRPLDKPAPVFDHRDGEGMSNHQEQQVGSAAMAEAAPLVRLRGISKRYGTVTAVKPLDLEIRRADFLAILGPSGCGKTTLLRIIGGFVAPTTGTVEIDGRDVTGWGPEKRPTNTVFQGYGLFPHMTVRQNIAYGLRTARRPEAEIRQRVDQAIALVRLEEFVDRSIDQLSGGQQQRVALARALIMQPRVLLLDEPLAALDLKLRQAMQEELRRIHRQIGGTFVFVTHDQGEALGLANRIAVMDKGEMIQVGGPEEIYAAPRTRFVSTFIGEANIFAGRRDGGQVTLDAGARMSSAGPDGLVTVVLRPEALRISPAALAADVVLAGTLMDMIYLGVFVKYIVALPTGQRVTVHNPDAALRRSLALNKPVQIGWSVEDQRVIGD
jgi:spermidine/putrescine transport system ATP-binding protein